MLLRRYTPPTCTLEIQAKESPLSRWMGKPVLKHLHFELRLDDPRQSEDKQVTIQGDRAQLEALLEAVDIYVQDFLDQSSTQMNYTWELGHPSAAVQVVPLPVQTSASSKIRALPNGISVQPRGLLSHDLLLGSLANNESGAVISLSATQLFDLSTALDQYAADAVALPSLNPRTVRSIAPMVWARTAAVVLITVGLTTAALKILDRSNQKPVMETAANPAASQYTAPEAPLPTPMASVSPIPSLTPLAPTEKIAPPSGAITPPAPTLKTSAPTQPNLAKQPSSPNTQIAIVPATAPVQSQPQPPVLPAPPVSQPAPIRVNPTPAIAQLPPLPSLENRRSPNVAQADAQPAARPNAAKRELPGNVAPQASVTTSGRASNEFNSPKIAIATLPQLAEVKNYLQPRWQPPADLKEPLEYSLVLKANGTIDRIIPITAAAGKYIERTGIPVIGANFVSPLESGNNARIRVILSPDGNVETSLE